MLDEADSAAQNERLNKQLNEIEKEIWKEDSPDSIELAVRAKNLFRTFSSPSKKLEEAVSSRAGAGGECERALVAAQLRNLVLETANRRSGNAKVKHKSNRFFLLLLLSIQGANDLSPRSRAGAYLPRPNSPRKL